MGHLNRFKVRKTTALFCAFLKCKWYVILIANGRTVNFLNQNLIYSPTLRREKVHIVEESRTSKMAISNSWYVMLFTTKYNHLLSVIITDTIHFVPLGSLCHQQTKRNSLSANRLKETEFLYHLRIHFVPKCHYNIVTARKIEAAAEKKISLRPMANTMKTRFTDWKDECSECQ